jgi:hypothetical protein
MANGLSISTAQYINQFYGIFYEWNTTGEPKELCSMGRGMTQTKMGELTSMTEWT